MELLQEAKRRIDEEIKEAVTLDAYNHQYVAGMINASVILRQLLTEQQDKMAEFYRPEFHKKNLSDL